MPIRDIRCYGDLTRAGSFRLDELRLINSTQDTIKSRLAGIPVPVVLHFINAERPIRGIVELRKHLRWNMPPRRPEQWQNVGLMTPELVSRMYGIAYTANDSAANLVLVENESLTRYPLTPWIIAHRIRHAFHYIPPADWAPAVKRVEQIEHDFFKNDDTDNLASLLDTAAGRADRLDDDIEFFPEVFASWCVRGRLGLRGLSPTEIILNNLLPTAYTEMLEWAVGKTVVL